MADKGKIHPTVPGTMIIPPTGNVFGNKRPGDNTPKPEPKRVGFFSRICKRIRRILR